MTDERRGDTRFAVTISNRQSLLRLEFAVTSRKQSLHTDSNRHNRDGLAAFPCIFRAVPIIPREFRAATQPNSENRANP